MYALAFYPEDDEDLPTLDRRIRDWLGKNASPGSWDTAWTTSNFSCPPIFYRGFHSACVRTLIENDDDAAMLKIIWTGKVRTIANYTNCMLLEELGLRKTGYQEIANYIVGSQLVNKLWTDGMFLYYADESDLVILKIAFAGND